MVASSRVTAAAGAASVAAKAAITIIRESFMSVFPVRARPGGPPEACLVPGRAGEAPSVAEKAFFKGVASLSLIEFE
jgi:hypothetical protein